MLSPSVSASLADHARAFADGQPFRHVVMEQFFAPDVLARLVADFPSFEHGDARNEAGEIAGKSTVERIRRLGPAYAELDDLLQSKAFLDLISEITGIPDLLYDPHYFGGGTHENRVGQDLDPHVDFNRHPITGWHRRLNLIVYLNPEWHDDWGGSLELYADPRSVDGEVKRITPQMNLAVIFETTERSWHGFTRIALPQALTGTTRRSIAVYFYTRTRPDEELADTHSTIYVDRPLGAHFRAGLTLSGADQLELETAITRRNQHIQRLYRDNTRLTVQLEIARTNLQQILGSGRLGRLLYAARALTKMLRGSS